MIQAITVLLAVLSFALPAASVPTAAAEDAARSILFSKDWGTLAGGREPIENLRPVPAEKIAASWTPKPSLPQRVDEIASAFLADNVAPDVRPLLRHFGPPELHVPTRAAPGSDLNRLRFITAVLNARLAAKKAQALDFGATSDEPCMFTFKVQRKTWDSVAAHIQRYHATDVPLAAGYAAMVLMRAAVGSATAAQVARAAAGDPFDAGDLGCRGGAQTAEWLRVALYSRGIEVKGAMPLSSLKLSNEDHCAPLPCPRSCGKCDKSTPKLNPLTGAWAASCDDGNVTIDVEDTETAESLGGRRMLTDAVDGGLGQWKLVCANQGKPGPNGKCKCPTQWTGKTCTQVQCLNSPNGTAADNYVTPVNTKTAQCKCRDGYMGLNCGICTVQGAPCLTGGGTCDRGLLITGTRRTYNCNLTNPALIAILGAGQPVRGLIKLDFNKPTGWVQPGNDGTIDFSLFREEPYGLYMDLFLFCSLLDCHTSVHIVITPAVYGPTSNSTKKVRKALSFIMLSFTAALTIIALPIPYVARYRARFAAGIYALLFASLIPTLYFGMFASGRKLIKPEERTHQLHYECEQTSCWCGPTQYWSRNYSHLEPACKVDVVGTSFLPMLHGKTNVNCNLNASTCAVVQSALPFMVFDGKCAGSSCEPTSNVPYHVTTELDKKSILAVEIVAASVGVLLFILLLHFLISTAFFKARAREFSKLFTAPAGQDLQDDDGSLRPVDDASPRECPSDLSQPLMPEPPEDTVVLALREACYRVKIDRPLQLPRWLHALLASEHPPHSESDDHSDVEHSDHDIQSQPAANSGADLNRNPFSHDTLDSAREEEDEGSSGPSSPVGPEPSQGGWKQILDSVNFSVQSGEVLALMGASGAGKTTLLDIVAQNAKDGSTTGDLMVNGEAINSSNRHVYKRITGFVAQHDLLIASLTVRQSVRHAARLKLPAPLSDDMVDDLVEEMIDALHLRDCVDTIVGSTDGGGADVRGISGGERRRVSIAMELIANPRVLLLDEPTSGLDSVNALLVMQAICGLAKGRAASHPAPSGRELHEGDTSSVSPSRASSHLSPGRGKRFKQQGFFKYRPVVVFSIHQPSTDVFRLFDKLLVLARGQVMYFGNAALAVAHTADVLGVDATRFGAKTPAEAILQMHYEASASRKQMLRDRPTPHQGVPRPADPSCAADAEGRASVDVVYGASGVLNTELSHVSSGTQRKILAHAAESFKYYPNLWQQLAVLCQRTKDALMGSYYLIASHAATTSGLALLLMYLYQEEPMDLNGTIDKAGMITFLLLIVGFSSLSVLDLFLAERALFASERENGYYRTVPYFVAKVLFDFIPLRILPVSVLSAVVYFPIGLRDNHIGFSWFVGMMTQFSIFSTAMSLCVGMLAPSFGAGALFGALFVLEQALFGGLLVQAATIPIEFKPFGYLSAFRYVFDTIMINELEGRQCLFHQYSSDGTQDPHAVQIACEQFLSHFGIDPSHFNRNIVCMAAMTLSMVGLALLLLIFAVRHKR